MAYEMLTGRLPFDADTPWAWATQHMTAQPFPFETVPLGSQVPLKMRTAVMRALSKDKTLRQQNVKEFYEEFTMGGGRVTGLGMARPSANDLAAASAAAAASAISGGGHTGPMTSARTQAGDIVMTPGPTTGGQAQYPSSPGMPMSPGGVPTGSGQVIQEPIGGKKSSAGPILGVVAVVAVLGIVGVVFALKPKGGGTGTANQSVDAGTQTTSSAPATITSASAAPKDEDAGTGSTEPAVDAGGPVAQVPTGPAGPVTPLPPGKDPKAEAACREAVSHADRDEIGAAKNAFARCEGQNKVAARIAIEQAEKRHTPGGKHHCPPGKRCPRGK
jgi:serine/threonine-protein kinase